MYKRFLLRAAVVSSLIVSSLILTASHSKPIKKSSTRNSKCTLSLVEVLQIRDTAEDFYFKYPGNIKVSEDGSIFLIDEDQLLKFNSKGNFVSNFFKKGQGPSELVSNTNYFIDGDLLIIHDSSLSKMLYINHQTGDMVKEFRIPGQAYRHFFAYSNDMLYFLENQPRDTQGKLKIIDVDVKLIKVEPKTKTVQHINSFSISHIVLKAGERKIVQRRSRLLHTSVDSDEIFISHTPEYGIKLFNFSRNQVAKRISRKFYRTKVTDETRKFAPGGNLGKISIDGVNFFKVPVDNYLPDIQLLFRYKNRLWAVTSEIHKGNNVLVDVYKQNGDFVKQFYIKCPPKVKPYRVRNWLKTISGDFLYAVEEDEDGQRMIKKYRIGFKNDK
jgi:hypothetical protein